MSSEISGPPERGTWYTLCRWDFADPQQHVEHSVTYSPRSRAGRAVSELCTRCEGRQRAFIAGSYRRQALLTGRLKRVFTEMDRSAGSGELAVVARGIER